jgi:predicted transposase/invertase (TIGR01784 family)
MKTVTFPPDADIIDIRADRAFKAVFTRETPESRGALAGLLSSLIGREVTVLLITANEPPSNFPGDKQIRYDISCKFNNGELADIEVTIDPKDSETLRLEYYATRLFVTQSVSGKHYRNLKYTYQISLVGDGKLFDDDSVVHNFEYYDKDGRLSLGGKTRIIIVELDKIGAVIARKGAEGIDGPERWAAFVRYSADKAKRELINAILTYEEAIAMAGETMLAFTKEEIEMYRRESALKRELDWSAAQIEAQDAAREKGLKEGLEEGLREGLEEGRAEGIEIGVEKTRKENQEESRKEKLQIARNLKQMGLSDTQIASATGLSPEEITNLNFMPPPADSVSGKDNVKK